ncbi:MAG: DUF58 domain-containing protein [Phycisphaeraceae bacterium JB051]
MTFLLMAVAMVGWYHTRMNLKGLVVSDWKAQPVFAGQDAVYRMNIQNDASRNRHGILPISKSGSQGSECHLVSGEQTELVLKRPAKKRGTLKPIAASIGSCFPLGIFQAKLSTADLPECMVYPKPAGNQPLPDKPIGKQAHLQAESGTFTDMRRYSPGDPMSRIHWQAMARFDELYTKEFDGAQGRPALWLRWDDVQATGVEEKLSQLCQWILEAHAQNREYGLEIPGSSIEPTDGSSHMHRCLSALATYGESEVSA